MGVNKANKLRLRAFNVTSGPEKGSCRLLAYVGGNWSPKSPTPAPANSAAAPPASSVGAAKNAKGAVASFDDVVVRVPSPF